jgi:hypothetical protein
MGPALQLRKLNDREVKQFAPGHKLVIEIKCRLEWTQQEFPGYLCNATPKFFSGISICYSPGQ